MSGAVASPHPPDLGHRSGPARCLVQDAGREERWCTTGQRRKQDLTHHNTNRSVLVEGPLIAVRPVSKRQVRAVEPYDSAS